MVTKTREKLIEVARQLFARKGMENTTMNDIANASDKGRRTVYTYFRNKREIYNAVIERESEQLVSRLKDVTAQRIDPEEKLRRYLTTRFEIVNETVRRPENTIRTLFSPDLRRLDRIRRRAVAKEQEMLASIIDEGVKAGRFDPAQSARFLDINTMMLQGIDFSHLRNNFREINLDPESARRLAVDFLVEGLTINHQ